MSEEQKTITRARVVVEVEVCDVGAWAGDCQLQQVYAQAKDSAIASIHYQLRTPVDPGDKPAGKYRVLSARVTAILAEEQRR